ncbi:alanine--tRNA ligase [Candidatus Bipolaricaulota bacterium]|nr:alanine--tRNA ligase [Candidatus Bipolaricaulota bacterium]
MKASELRTRYLEFFAARDHKNVPSSPLVPKDPTLLFTSAGMVQFKDYLAGHAAAPYPRVTTCQKCFRTTDIEKVGKTAFHQTFFEMLGNFSFGDYFKEGAIDLAWEFLIRELEIEESKLWISIYQDDDEAYDIWHDVIGVPSDRIVRLGKEHNWWGLAGNSGPCGPDSEIHYDTGIENGCGDPDCTGLACDCNRFSEIWNLVFMQYEAQEDGTLVPLDKQNVDTGMGLERTATTLQGAETNFETDLFRPIVEAIDAASPRSLDKDDLVYRNTIADHVRAVLFLLSEGVMPSNERQGYVLRRILRRAIRAGEHLELAPGSLATFIDPVIETMGTVYPEIVESRDLARRLITREEETFRRTLRDGERRLNKVLDELAKSGVSVLAGEAAFELNDTYGFPLEMTQEIAADRGFSVDLASYEKALEKQRARSRVSIEASTSLRAEATVIRGWHRRNDDDQFSGYEQHSVESTVTGFDEAERQVAFSQTPFYPQAGGQVADTGAIENLTKRSKVRVVNTTRHEAGAILHHIAGESAEFESGDECLLVVDNERRDRIQRNHTATHLLHAGLREVLGSHVKQAGSLVNDVELRFDFSHFEKMTDEQIAQVEDYANAAVLADHQVSTELLSPEQATESGAIGLFEDEYRGKSEVRVVSVDEVSKELCGGTHVSRSGEIGLIKIVSEESIAAGTRRIRAITGDAVLTYLRQQDAFRQLMHEQLGDDPAAGIDQLKSQIEALTSQLDEFVANRLQTLSQEIADMAIGVGDTNLVVRRADLPGDQLKELADMIEERTQPSVIILAGKASGQALVVCKVSKGIKAIRAGDIVKSMSQALGGGGGGAPTFAQGGGQDTTKIDEVLESAADEVQQALG